MPSKIGITPEDTNHPNIKFVCRPGSMRNLNDVVRVLDGNTIALASYNDCNIIAQALNYWYLNNPEAYKV